MEEKNAEISSRGDSVPTPPAVPAGGDGSENLRDEINEDDERSENSADQISRIIETFQGEMRAHIQQRRAKKEKQSEDMYELVAQAFSQAASLLVKSVSKSQSQRGTPAGEQRQEEDTSRFYTGQTASDYIPLESSAAVPPRHRGREQRNQQWAKATAGDQRKQSVQHDQERGNESGHSSLSDEAPKSNRARQEHDGNGNRTTDSNRGDYDPWLDTEDLDSYSDDEDGRNSYHHRQSAAKRPANRRESIVKKLTFTDESAPRRSAVRVTRAQPDYSHIRLDAIKLRPYLAFIEAIWEYEQKHGISVPVATLLSKTVREEIIARNPRVSPDNFYDLSTRQVLKLLQREIRPEGRVTFHKELVNNTRFPELPRNYVPEASNFKVFYDALLLYRFRFLRVYQILADGNPPENIPKCENKDGGLIKMFLDNIPFEYGTRLHRELPSSKYAHIEDYLVDFFDQVKLDFNAYRTARRTNDRFGGTVVAAKQVTSTTIGTPQYRTAPTQQTGQRSGTSGNQQRSGPGVTFANQRPQQRLHMIQDAVTDSDASHARSGQQQPDLTTADEHDLRLALQHDSNSSAEDEIDQTHDEVAAQIDTHSAAVDTNDYDTPMYVPEDSDVDLDAAGVSSPSPVMAEDAPRRVLNQLQQNFQRRDQYPQQANHGNKTGGKGQQPFPRGCQNMLFTNRCDKGHNCRYSHEPSVLAETARVISAILERGPYMRSSAKGYPQQQNPRPHSLSHIRLDHRLDLCGVDAVDGGHLTTTASPTCHPSICQVDGGQDDLHALDSLLHHMMLKESPEATIIRAVYCTGQATLPCPDGDSALCSSWLVTVPNVLFDSGALSGSYISNTFVEKHCDVLQPYLRKVSGDIRLAVEGFKVPIEHTLCLQMSFVSPSGKRYAGNVMFTVLPTLPDTDMIIGLPNILLQFNSLHKEMLDQAVRRLASLPASVTSNILSPSFSPSFDRQSRVVSSILLPKNSDNKTVKDWMTLPSTDEDVALRYPWSITVEQTAPEDDECPLPCSFPTVLHFMEMSHSEALKEYRSLYDTHVAKEFAAAVPAIFQLLDTKGSKVFVPSNWEIGRAHV